MPDSKELIEKIRREYEEFEERAGIKREREFIRNNIVPQFKQILKNDPFLMRRLEEKLGITHNPNRLEAEEKIINDFLLSIGTPVYYYGSDPKRVLLVNTSDLGESKEGDNILYD